MVWRNWVELERWVKSSRLRSWIAEAIINTIAFVVFIYLIALILGALLGPFSKMPVGGYLGN